MFDRSVIDSFDNATPNGRVASKDNALEATPIRRRKTLKEKLTFTGINLIIAPPAAIVVITIAAEGIRNLLEITAMKLHRVPLPLMQRLEMYEGFADMDLSHVISALLCLAVTFIWIRVIKESKGIGNVLAYRQDMPPLFYLYTGVAATMILLDALVFFLGVRARGGGFGDMPIFIALTCTIFYMAAVASYAIFHADYATSKKI